MPRPETFKINGTMKGQTQKQKNAIEVSLFKYEYPKEHVHVAIRR